MAVPPYILNSIKRYYQHTCEFGPQDERCRQYKHEFKELFTKYVSTHNPEETEGLIHNLKKIGTPTSESDELGIEALNFVVLKAGKWLKKGSPKPSQLRKILRKSLILKDNSEVEMICGSAKTYMIVRERLLQNEMYQEGHKAKAVLIDCFKSDSPEIRLGKLRQIQEQLNHEITAKSDVELCMQRLNLLLLKGTS